MEYVVFAAVAVALAAMGYVAFRRRPATPAEAGTATGPVPGVSAVPAAAPAPIGPEMVITRQLDLGVRHVPIVDERGIVTGIVSLRDALRPLLVDALSAS